jgi:hypothetical protein
MLPHQVGDSVEGAIIVATRQIFDVRSYRGGMFCFAHHDSRRGRQRPKAVRLRRNRLANESGYLA